MSKKLRIKNTRRTIVATYLNWLDVFDSDTQTWVHPWYADGSAYKIAETARGELVFARLHIGL